MAKLIYRKPNDPSQKKNYKPKSIIYKRILFLSIVINLIQAAAIINYLS